MKLIFSALDDIRLWPHFKDHYVQQGISQFLCVSYGPRPDGALIIPASIPPSLFTGDNDAVQHNAVIDRYVCRDEWCIIADLDEFAEFPGTTLLQEVRVAEKYGANVVMGTFRDRITEDGDFPAHLGPDIWSQFPLQTNATESLTSGWPHKVIVFRGTKRVGSGHHTVIHHENAKVWRNNGIVHHFKWWGNPRRFGVRFDEQGVYRAELNRLEKYLASNNYRINLADITVYNS
jgi:hypothetical protein